MTDDINRYLSNINRLIKLIEEESTEPSVREYAENALKEAESLSKAVEGASGADKPSGAAGTEAVKAASEKEAAPLVLIIDDDEIIRGTCGAVLGKIFRTDTAGSCDEALSKLAARIPSLILLDVMMPGTDGFGTLAKIRRDPRYSSIPVIFLTGSEDRDTEIRCLKAGAADYVRKPIVTEVLTERVRRIIELDRLQHDLHSEVVTQTVRADRLTNQIMLALSETVDAKDHYTHGHSRRVAAYASEIARRMGRPKSEQSDIYAMGLLHDVGKIGVSEAIINKSSRLTDEEYAQIKTHTTVGYDILKIITEIPGLATGARWHHERYDGRGYPDGLKGTDIPLEARIICVADCYDAMTSNRSYSNVREQAAVKAEILRCRGSQFDPDIADIMIAMIDDDPEYRMSEYSGRTAEVPHIPHDIAAAQFVDDEAGYTAADDGGEAAFIPEITGLDLAAARRNISDEKILALTLRRFCELMPSKLGKLAEAYETARGGGDITDYRIEVHAMKSSSATVGFSALSEAAKALEAMAKNNDLEGITAHHEPFRREWEDAYERLSAAYREHEKAAEPELTDVGAALPELLGMLVSDIENMDIDAADDDIGAILSFSYSESLKQLIDELRIHVLELDEDAVRETAEKIMKGIGR